MTAAPKWPLPARHLAAQERRREYTDCRRDRNQYAGSNADPLDNVQAHIETITQAEQAFSDDFRRDDGHWKTKSTDKAVTFAYANRALHIRIDKKNWLTWTFNQQIDALSLSDFYLESDVAAVGAPDDAQFGVIFRFVDNKNFYKFAISRSGTYSLIKSVDDEWETIVDLNEGRRHSN